MRKQYYSIRRKYIVWKRKMDRRLKILFLPLLIPKYLLEQAALGHVPRFEWILVEMDSPLERRLYYALRKHYKGKIRAQYPFGPYWIDLALPEYKLALECDGDSYHSGRKMQEHDQKRDAYMRKRGWKVMRFSTRQLKYFMPSVVKRIQQYTEKMNQKKNA